MIISRGQLIEIGGSFRIPEIMAVSGAILREVGTTNITRLADYERAIGPNTGALMQVHTSNYRISGFTKSVPLAELVALGQKHGLPVIDDIGSGALLDFARFGFQGEPVARASIAAGADLVLFSGDKLLGGPQAGIIAGRKEWIQKIEKDPLMRAFRLDKMTLAALEATLRLYLNEERALREVPVLRMLGTSLIELRQRAEKLADGLRSIEGLASVEDGGGRRLCRRRLAAGPEHENLGGRDRGQTVSDDEVGPSPAPGHARRHGPSARRQAGPRCAHHLRASGTIADRGGANGSRPNRKTINRQDAKDAKEKKEEKKGTNSRWFSLSFLSLESLASWRFILYRSRLPGTV